jgi:hypothetical protein
MINSLPDIKDGTCPSERFSGVEVAPNIKANHTCGCPVYALNSKLAAGKSIPKWDSRARVGLYLPGHARNVYLVLSLDTSLVSPQFHVHHDNLFETVSPKAGNTTVLSYWQKLSGLRLDGKPEKTRQNGIVGINPRTKKSGVVPSVSV